MVTIKSDVKGRLHHLYVRDRNLKQCFFTLKEAINARDALNAKIKAALPQFKRVA